MPYRSDGRTHAQREAKIQELSVAVERAQQRVRAVAGKLKALERRLDVDGRDLDQRVADAEDAKRRATLLSLAKSGTGDDGRVRRALHTQGVVNALERAMSGAKRPRRVLKTEELASLEQARAALHEARKERAWLETRSEPSLSRARARLGDAVAAYDEAVTAHRMLADSMASS